MSGVRSPLGRFILVAPFLLLACTKATPHYCESQANCNAGTCDLVSHYCVVADGGDDGGPTVDAPVDSPSDAPADTATGDAPHNVGDGGDGGDTRADADAGEVHTGCVTNDDCRADAGTPVCQYVTGRCVGCLHDTDCKDPQAAVCDTGATTCVQCLLPRDCTDPTAPICDTKICRGCRTDGDCAGVGPEVCMSHIDGHCATDDETVYVMNVSGSCSDTGSGTRVLPICKSQVAIDLATTSGSPAGADAGANDDAAAGTGNDGGPARKIIKDLVVMRGPSLTPWSFAIADRTISVVGQTDATLIAGGYVGVRVDNGTVYLRNLHITAGTFGPGVVADGGEIHVDRCVIDANVGGILVDGAGFEITNTIIANNNQASFNVTTSWGGVILGAVPTGRPARFQNNTVVMNKAPGLFCTQGNPHDVSASIVFNNMLGDGGGCTGAACCTGDPMLTPAFRFSAAASPCKDKLTAIMSTAYDIDGDRRPSGALSDCGADEYVAPTP
jgi:hypothetical protein